MTLVRTLVGKSESLCDTTNSSTHDGTFDCGTVTDGDLLIIGCGGTGGDTFFTTPIWTTPSKSSGTATIGTVTEIADASPAASYKASVRVWYVEVTGTGTLVLNYGDAADSYGPGIIVYKYTGWNTTTPILSGAVSATRQTAGNFSPTTATLGTAPAADDETLQFTDWDTDAGTKGDLTAGSGFTMRDELGGGDDYTNFGCSTRTGSTSTTLTWNTDDGSPSNYSSAGVGFTVQAAAAPAGNDIVVGMELGIA